MSLKDIFWNLVFTRQTVTHAQTTENVDRHLAYASDHACNQNEFQLNHRLGLELNTVTSLIHNLTEISPVILQWLHEDEIMASW